MTRYTKPGTTELDDGFSEAVTREVGITDLLDRHIHEWIRKETTRYPQGTAVLITTEAHWSGYSEYTITSQWEEVWITVPAWNFERRFRDLPTFFAALGAVGDRNAYEEDA